MRRAVGKHPSAAPRHGADRLLTTAGPVWVNRAVDAGLGQCSGMTPERGLDSEHVRRLVASRLDVRRARNEAARPSLPRDVLATSLTLTSRDQGA